MKTIVFQVRQSFSFMAILLMLILSIGFVSTGFAQEHQHEPSLAIDAIPLELFTKPVTIRKGVGAVSDPVTTSSKEAQAFYNQGVGYLHSYVWIEAARSFHQALRLDPKLAMAQAGIYRAYAGQGLMAAAREALDKAVQLIPAASPRERRRVLIHTRQFEALADISNQAKHQDYKKALDDALAIDATDVELWLLRGNAAEGIAAAGRGQRGMDEALKFYLRALELSPDHPGAHHYLTHTYENLGRVNEALKHGEACARLAPQVPHMLHMYGHDLRRVGRIKEAIAQFIKADEVQRAYFDTEKIAPEYDWHYQHNLDLLSTCYQHQGQMKRAEELMKQAFNLPTTMEAEAYNKNEYPAFLLARGRADEAIAAAAVLKKTKWDTVRVIGHILTAQALMNQDKMQEASAEATAALRTLQASGKNFPLAYTDLAILQGEFFLRTNQAEKGRTILKQAITKLRGEQGPDNWTLALFKLDAMAKAARESGDWELADYIAGQMLEHDTNYAGAHFAMALVAEQKGDKTRAAAEYAMAEKLWSDADKDLPEIGQIRLKLESLKK